MTDSRLSPAEDRIWRAHLLGCYGQHMGLDKLLKAIESPEAFDAACESREARLDRELRVERQRLLALRVEPVVPVVDFEPVPVTPEADWMWEASAA